MEALAPALPKTRKKRLTYKDYAALTPPDSGNYELHGGKIVYMPSLTPARQRMSRRLAVRLNNFLEKTNREFLGSVR